MLVKVFVHPFDVEVEPVQLWQLDSFLRSWRHFTSHPRGFFSPSELKSSCPNSIIYVHDETDDLFSSVHIKR